MKYQPQGTIVLEKNLEAFNSDCRFVVNQGGTRSSKTYSIAQLFIAILFGRPNTLLTVCRKTLPSLKASAMRDFFEILKEQNLYDESCHNKSDNTYTYKTSEIEFISVDQPQKIRGRKREYLWINEANELSYEDFRQLNLRTIKQIYMDFNPSDEFHWIYDYILTRPNCKFIQSTYKDNPFLEDDVIQEIELLKNTDQNYWRIYGLGERGTTEAAIYNHWKLCDDLPEGEKVFGLDFGFNNQTALVEVIIKDDQYYVAERLYERHLTNSDLIEKLKQMVKENKLTYNNTIVADCAEPQRIQEIKQADFNIIAADKDVKKGIDEVRSHALFITKDSTNLLKEIKNYKWKTKDDQILDEPVKFNDHAVDALRYAVHTTRSGWLDYIKLEAEKVKTI